MVSEFIYTPSSFGFCPYSASGSAADYLFYVLQPLFVGFICVASLFRFAVLCVLFSFAIVWPGKRELVAIVLFCSDVLNVMSLLSFFDPSSLCHGPVCSM